MKPRREIENTAAEMKSDRESCVSDTIKQDMPDWKTDLQINTIEAIFQSGMAGLTLEVLLDIRDLLQREAY